MSKEQLSAKELILIFVVCKIDTFFLINETNIA